MFKTFRESFYKITFLFLIFGLSCKVQALPEDNKSKLTITANYSIYNYKTGLCTYKGAVEVNQGTTHLTADLLITKDNHKQINEAIAYGLKQLAHYSTLPKPADKILHAYAKVIHFYPLQSLVRLEKNVVVQQGENRLQGELILYDTKNQTVTVPALKNSRVILLYKSSTPNIGSS